ncbi:MAG: hypothetical protein ACR5KX_01710 [Wolbachia sp.]
MHPAEILAVQTLNNTWGCGSIVRSFNHPMYIGPLGLCLKYGTGSRVAVE